jgi:hypothetical protein
MAAAANAQESEEEGEGSVSYRVNRAEGYRPWGVTNPWVFANYGQPQRGRGYVSPLVMQTHAPLLRSMHLGQAVESESERRAVRMETMAIIGLALSSTYLVIALSKMKKVSPNRRRRRSK